MTRPCWPDTHTQDMHRDRDVLQGLPRNQRGPQDAQKSRGTGLQAGKREQPPPRQKREPAQPSRAPWPVFQHDPHRLRTASQRPHARPTRARPTVALAPTTAVKGALWLPEESGADCLGGAPATNSGEQLLEENGKNRGKSCEGIRNLPLQSPAHPAHQSGQGPSCPGLSQSAGVAARHAQCRGRRCPGHMGVEAGVMAPFSPGPGVGGVVAPGPPPSCPHIRGSEEGQARRWLKEEAQRGQRAVATLSSLPLIHWVPPTARRPPNQVPRAWPRGGSRPGSGQLWCRPAPPPSLRGGHGWVGGEVHTAFQPRPLPEAQSPPFLPPLLLCSPCPSLQGPPRPWAPPRG